MIASSINASSGEETSFVADGGHGRNFDGLWWACGRYLELYVETDNEALTVETVTLLETRCYLPGVYEQTGSGFKVIPRRWVTFAWLTFQRRLNRDYEFLVSTSEALIYLAMIRIMVRRLAC